MHCGSLTEEIEPHLHDRDRIIIEDSWNIFARELVCRVGNEEARLSNGTVTHDYTPSTRIRLADD